MARSIHRDTQLDTLPAGGVALNCVGNGRLPRGRPVQELRDPAHAGDGGRRRRPAHPASTVRYSRTADGRVIWMVGFTSARK